MTALSPEDCPVGYRAELHPATDAWMRGDRFGTVERHSRTRVYVKADSGRVYAFAPVNILRCWRVDVEPSTH